MSDDPTIGFLKADVVEDLHPADKRGKITAKGGATEWIHWQSGAARLLPRLIARRTCGPLVPHRPQGPGRDADAGRVPGGRQGPALLPPG